MKTLRILLAPLIFLACGFLGGCGGSSHSTPAPVIATSGQNVVAITVDGGPAPPYPDAAFASITVCLPGTSTCQPIDHLLVDTGSSGVRIVSSVLTLALPQQTSNSIPVVECLQFLASYTWGPVQTADIQIGGEKASSVPVQVLSDTDFTAPSACTSAGPSGDSVAALGAKGILGVGQTVQDCSPSTCPASANFYYTCTSPTAVCTPIAQNAAQQVTNPVALFATDNNGVIVELPKVSGGVQTTLSGSLVFGIGTQSNNALGSATVYTVDPSTLNFTTLFNSQSFTDAAFLDSGSNGYFFEDSSIPVCSDNPGFYCPLSTQSLSATNQGITSGSGVVQFSVGNADNYFANPSDNALGDLGGTTQGGTYFDWGLPFFFGRNVFTAIDLANTPAGTGPYWAY